MLENLPDKALLRGVEEQVGFRILYNRYWEELYKKAFHRFGNSADAEDAVQEIFISVWRNRTTIQIGETLAPYLFTALKYYIIKQVYLKAKRGIQVNLSTENLEYIELSTEELLQYKELQSVIVSKVGELPERMREVYRLSRIENFKLAEIAAKLNISEQTVKNTLNTALKRLRKDLSKYYCALIFFL